MVMGKTKRQSGKGKRTLALVGLVLWVSLPLVGIGAFLARDDSIAIAPGTDVWSPIEASSGESVTPVGLALTWSTPASLVSPAWSGLVQRVIAGPGAVVSDGTAVVTISGIERRAYKTDIPFSEYLGAGSRGAEATELNALLDRAGLSSGPGDRITTASVQGIRQLAAAIGVPNAAQVTTFDPGWVLYLEDDLVVENVLASVGEPAPPAGEDLLTAQQELQSAELVDQAYLDRISNLEEPPPAHIIEVGERREVPEGSALWLGTSEIATGEDRGLVDRSALPLVQTVVQFGAATATGRIVEPTAGQWSVPIPAVFAGSSNATCVIVRRQGEPVSLPVAIVGEGVSSILVDGELRASDTVLIAPAGGLRECA